jgi:hypothetical protein
MILGLSCYTVVRLVLELATESLVSSCKRVNILRFVKENVQVSVV